MVVGKLIELVFLGFGGRVCILVFGDGSNVFRVLLRYYLSIIWVKWDLRLLPKFFIFLFDFFGIIVCFCGESGFGGLVSR